MCEEIGWPLKGGTEFCRSLLRAKSNARPVFGSSSTTLASSKGDFRFEFFSSLFTA